MAELKGWESEGAWLTYRGMIFNGIEFGAGWWTAKAVDHTGKNMANGSGLTPDDAMAELKASIDDLHDFKDGADAGV